MTNGMWAPDAVICGWPPWVMGMSTSNIYCSRNESYSSVYATVLRKHDATFVRLTLLHNSHCWTTHIVAQLTLLDIHIVAQLSLVYTLNCCTLLIVAQLILYLNQTHSASCLEDILQPIPLSSNLYHLCKHSTILIVDVSISLSSSVLGPD